MNDAFQSEPAMATVLDGPAPALDHRDEPLTVEKRLDHLEKLVVDLTNSRELEERITARILEKLPETMQSPRWYQRMNPFRRPAIPAATGWVVFELFSDVRFVIGMLFDRRFAMSWISRGIVAAALFVAFTASFWLTPFGLIPLIGSTIQGVLATLLILLCGGLTFKVLHREAKRYCNTLENDNT